MSHDVANTVVATAIALRVFAPDAWRIARWMLGAGVRAGVHALAERPPRVPRTLVLTDTAEPAREGDR